MYRVAYYNSHGQRFFVQDGAGTAIFQTAHTAELVAAEFREDYSLVCVIPLSAL